MGPKMTFQILPHSTGVKPQTVYTLMSKTHTLSSGPNLTGPCRSALTSPLQCVIFMFMQFSLLPFQCQARGVRRSFVSMSHNRIKTVVWGCSSCDFMCFKVDLPDVFFFFQQSSPMTLCCALALDHLLWLHFRFYGFWRCLPILQAYKFPCNVIGVWVYLSLSVGPKHHVSPWVVIGSHIHP